MPGSQSKKSKNATLNFLQNFGFTDLQISLVPCS
jgi:hypothetical protein